LADALGAVHAQEMGEEAAVMAGVVGERAQRAPDDLAGLDLAQVAARPGDDPGRQGKAGRGDGRHAPVLGGVNRQPVAPAGRLQVGEVPEKLKGPPQLLG
jgi:hypothetical protein